MTVKLFARLREIAGDSDWRQEIEEIAPDASVRDVWRAVVGRHPALEPYGGSISCAVNANFARMTALVHDGDEIAFLPPVSGG